jgi:hypothetical protein
VMVLSLCSMVSESGNLRSRVWNRDSVTVQRLY